MGIKNWWPWSKGDKHTPEKHAVAYAIVQVTMDDEADMGSTQFVTKIHVKEIVWSGEEAENTVSELNAANEDPKTYYFWESCRVRH